MPTRTPSSALSRNQSLLLALLILGLGLNTVYRAVWTDTPHTDFLVYRDAGMAILDHLDPYGIQSVGRLNYVYPPPFAIAMAPLAWLPSVSGITVWYVILISALVVSALLSARIVQEHHPAARGKASVYAYPLLLLSPWLASGIVRAQASELIIGLTIAIFYYYRTRHPWRSGACLAIAGLIKVFPLSLLAYFLWKKQWRILAATALFLALGGLAFPAISIGWHQTLHYWQEWFMSVAAPSLTAGGNKASFLYEQLLDQAKPRNQSLAALALTLDIPKAWINPAIAALASAMLILMARKNAAHPTSEPFIICAFICWSLLIPPVSESHYFGAMILPLALLTARFESTAQPMERQWIKGIMLVVAAVSLVTLYGSRSFEMLRPLCWVTLAVWTGLMLLSRRMREQYPLVPVTRCRLT